MNDHTPIISFETMRDSIESFSTEASSGCSNSDLYEEKVWQREPVYSLREQLMLETKDRLLELSDVYTLQDLSGLEKDELAAALIPMIIANVDLIEETLARCAKGAFDSMRSAFEAGGVISLPTKRAREMVPFAPFSYLFEHEGKSTLVMSPEIREMLGKIDWDELSELREREDQISHCARVCADYYGVVGLADFTRQFEKWYGYGLSVKDMLDEVLTAATWGEDRYSLWYAEDEICLIALDLSEEGALFDPTNIDDMAHLEIYREYLRKCHAKIPRKPLDPVLKDVELFDWKVKQPSALRLHNFLRTHILDVDNDYLFVEDIVEDLIVISAGSYNSEFIEEYLDNQGLLGKPASTSILMALVAEMLDNMPRWENNGWSNLELRGLDVGKTFYNETGKQIKVGRNDPCPCGSGKKYKKCCGR